jgi:hypothetical protein
MTKYTKRREGIFVHFLPSLYFFNTKKHFNREKENHLMGGEKLTKISVWGGWELSKTLYLYTFDFFTAHLVRSFFSWRWLMHFCHIFSNNSIPTTNHRQAMPCASLMWFIDRTICRKKAAKNYTGVGRKEVFINVMIAKMN